MEVKGYEQECSDGVCEGVSRGGLGVEEHTLLRLSKYTYLGIEFTSIGAWDVHIRKVLDSGRKKVN